MLWYSPLDTTFFDCLHVRSDCGITFTKICAVAHATSQHCPTFHHMLRGGISGGLGKCQVLALRPSPFTDWLCIWQLSGECTVRRALRSAALQSLSAEHADGLAFLVHADALRLASRTLEGACSCGQSVALGHAPCQLKTLRFTAC